MCPYNQKQYNVLIVYHYSSYIASLHKEDSCCLPNKLASIEKNTLHLNLTLKLLFVKTLCTPGSVH